MDKCTHIYFADYACPECQSYVYISIKRCSHVCNSNRARKSMSLHGIPIPINKACWPRQCTATLMYSVCRYWLEYVLCVRVIVLNLTISVQRRQTWRLASWLWTFSLSFSGFDLISFVATRDIIQWLQHHTRTAVDKNNVRGGASQLSWRYWGVPEGCAISQRTISLF